MDVIDTQRCAAAIHLCLGFDAFTSFGSQQIGQEDVSWSAAAHVEVITQTDTLDCYLVHALDVNRFHMSLPFQRPSPVSG